MLEAECRYNVEVIWLMDKLAPDFKTIADFRKDNLKRVLDLVSFDKSTSILRRSNCFCAPHSLPAELFTQPRAWLGHVMSR